MPKWNKSSTPETVWHRPRSARRRRWLTIGIRTSARVVFPSGRPDAMKGPTIPLLTSTGHPRGVFESGERSPCPTAAAGRPLQLCSGPSGASSTDWARPLKLGIGGLRKVAFREFGTVIDFRLGARRSGNSSIDRTMIDRRRTLSTPRRSITMELHQSGRHWTLGRSSGILFTEDSSGIAAASGIRSLPNY